MLFQYQKGKILLTLIVTLNAFTIYEIKATWSNPQKFVEITQFECTLTELRYKTEIFQLHPRILVNPESSQSHTDIL